jgi:hypothetical protein
MGEMTDPRVAALAEALNAVIDGGFYYRDLHKTRPAEDAAAILAALPYGWDPDSDEEWRRLRKIEEAARAYIVAVDVLYRKGTREDWWKREATLDALRAALGEEP